MAGKIKNRKKEFDQVGLFIISLTTTAHPITTMSQKKGPRAELNRSQSGTVFSAIPIL
jgi:hypothetical protein